MNILTELWQMRYVASEACAVLMLFGSFIMSVVAIYMVFENKTRIDRQVKKGGGRIEEGQGRKQAADGQRQGKV